MTDTQILEFLPTVYDVPVLQNYDFPLNLLEVDTNGFLMADVIMMVWSRKKPIINWPMFTHVQLP